MNRSEIFKSPEGIERKLGDSHNFGLATSKLQSGKIWKPRRCFWESSFLSASGVFRKLLGETLFSSSNFQIIDLLPRVEYQLLETNTCIIEPLIFSELKSDLSLSFWEGVGALLAVSKFFGWQDLHVENIAMGYDQNERVFFGPIDLECNFTSIRNLSQTHLLPSEGMIPSFAGLHPLKEKLSHSDSSALAVMVGSYCACLGTLSNRSSMFLDVVEAYAKQEPQRVVLRPTGVYYELLRSGEQSRYSVMREEREQLNRNEIPYFCTFWNDRNLYYYREPGKLAPLEHDQWKTLVGNRMPISRFDLALHNLESDIDSLINYFCEERFESSSYAGIKIVFQSKKFQIEMSGAYRPINA